MPVLVEWMVQQAPHCRLEVCELADSDYERELEKGELDLVIGFAGANHLSPRLWREEWFSNPLVCLSPSAAPCPTCWGRENWSAAPISTPPSWGHSQAMVDLWLARFGVERELGSGCRALWRYRR